MEQINKTPLYTNNAAYAREHGELDQFRASHRANMACKDDIERAIGRSFDGMYLKHDAPTEILNKYGIERVKFILAATVQTKAWDGRFSKSNKDWAMACSLPDTSTSYGEDRLYEYAVDSHPAVADGFIHLARAEMAAREKPSEKDELRQTAASKPKVPSKKESIER